MGLYDRYIYQIPRQYLKTGKIWVTESSSATFSLPASLTNAYGRLVLLQYAALWCLFISKMATLFFQRAASNWHPSHVAALRRSSLARMGGLFSILIYPGSLAARLG